MLISGFKQDMRVQFEGFWITVYPTPSSCFNYCKVQGLQKLWYSNKGVIPTLRMLKYLSTYPLDLANTINKYLYRLSSSCTEFCNICHCFVMFNYLLYNLKSTILLQAYKPTCRGLLLPVTDYGIVSYKYLIFLKAKVQVSLWCWLLLLFIPL